jgi:CBS domain-containing protein
LTLIETRLQPVANVMTGAVVVVEASTAVADAGWIAGEEGIHHLIVLDSGMLVGVVCEYDLALVQRDVCVRDCMSAPAVCIDWQAPLADAAHLMLERAIGCLAVVAGADLVGIVTRGDLRRAGLAFDDVASAVCASCGTDDHVRLDPRTGGAAFCIECLERPRSSEDDEDIGGGD